MYQEYDMTSYHLYVIPTNRFKRNTVRLEFKKPIEKKEISLFLFLFSILFEGSKKYPTARLIQLETNNLYGLGWEYDMFLSGNCMFGTIEFQFLDESYTEKGMTKKSFDFLKEILFHPNVENGSFKEETIELVRYNFKEAIRKEKENHTAYAYRKLLSIIGKDTPISYSRMGYLEDFESITGKNLYDYYQNFLKTADLEIYVCGRTNVDWKKEISDFIPINTLKRQKKNSLFITHSKFSKRVKTVVEKDQNNQSILYLGCKVKELTLFEKQYVSYVYNYILGGGMDSLLFQNVREKHSLCYSISSTFERANHLLLIKAGIDGEHVQKTEKLIREQIKKMECGKFSDSMIQNAVAVYLEAKNELTDSVGGLIGNLNAHVNVGYDLYEKQKEEILKVTKEDIIRLSKKVVPEVFFLLEGEETNEED